MNYLEVKIFTTTYGIDQVTGLLLDMDIEAFVVEDAQDFETFLSNKKPFDWDYVDEKLMELMEIETCIILYLDDSKIGKDKLAILKEKIKELKGTDAEGVLGRLLVESILVCDDDWKDKWKQYFKPTRISDRIVVKPTWENYKKLSDDEIVINVDPGMAFGTGTHETTSMCLRLLEKFIESGVDDVLDLGCGSGILAISASLLGAKSSTGVDIDPVAVSVSYENINLNGLQDKVVVFEGDLTNDIDIMADIIVANLVAELILVLLKDIKNHLKGKKIFISSGILIEKQEIVAEALREANFKIIDIVNEGDWAAISATLNINE
ncbi:MAG: 50S ribosomal protein L11 methyltransferase [Eubacteriales bacterium]